jgi:hypothetical protein
MTCELCGRPVRNSYGVCSRTEARGGGPGCEPEYQKRRRGLEPRSKALPKSLKPRSKAHPKTGGPEWQSWHAMISRCTLPNHKSYRLYGGRGITVCDRWLPSAGGSFANFLADMGERPPGTSIDRKDNNGNYEPGNCIWSDRKGQNSNRRPWTRSRLLGKHEASETA